jgi:hypothetical protein
MKKLMRRFVGTGILYLIVQVIVGIILSLVFKWELIEVLASSIINGIIFIVIWIATGKLIIEKDIGKEE